jgi:outer membrane protein assembly factor BamB
MRFCLFVLLVGGAMPLSAQSSVWALSVAKPVWQTAIGTTVMGLPSVQDASVAVVCNGGSVKVYGEDGKTLWTYTTPGRLAPYITRSPEGVCYVCRTNGTLIAINRIGRELWRVRIGAPLVAPVLTGWDGRLFAVTSRKVACYTAAGALLWDIPLQHAIAVAPVLDRRGGFVLALDNGELLRLSAFGALTTQQLRAAPSVLVPLAPPEARNDGSIIEETRVPILALYPNGAMELVGRTASPPLPTLSAAPKAAVNGNGKNAANVAITLINGKVLLLSLDEGALLWTAESNVEIAKLRDEDATVVLRYDEQGVYMLSQAGAAAFNVDGQRRWFIRLIGASSLPAWSDAGILISGGKDWILYAYRFEERRPPRLWSPYAPVPEGVYGLGDLLAAEGGINETLFTSRLKRINAAIREGTVGADEPEFTALLMKAAGSMRNGTRAARTNPLQVNHRVEAAQLLASLGSRELIPFLVDLFISDPDPLVKAAAADSIGRIGVDPDGLAMEAFTKAILQARSPQDPQTLVALAGAIGSLCRFTGPSLSAVGVKLLVALMSDTNPSAVRTRARQELTSLQS